MPVWIHPQPERLLCARPTQGPRARRAVRAAALSGKVGHHARLCQPRPGVCRRSCLHRLGPGADAGGPRGGKELGGGTPRGLPLICRFSLRRRRRLALLCSREPSASSTCGGTQRSSPPQVHALFLPDLRSGHLLIRWVHRIATRRDYTTRPDQSPRPRGAASMQHHALWYTGRASHPQEAPCV